MSSFPPAPGRAIDVGDSTAVAAKLAAYLTGRSACGWGEVRRRLARRAFPEPASF